MELPPDECPHFHDFLYERILCRLMDLTGWDEQDASRPASKLTYTAALAVLQFYGAA